MSHNFQPRIDCNWIVREAVAMRSELREHLLAGVSDVEERARIKVELNRMDYNELRRALKERKR